ncbi:MAG: HAMP domain-containing histidine kinase [Chitinophagales bacterium]|nr:HAMP domain-containing histidine kinase [Chitinophagales bacterium]MCZ2392391.1 HAMP domain-containing histidine kinase [Chitinophagales bacterium]
MRIIKNKHDYYFILLGVGLLLLVFSYIFNQYHNERFAVRKSVKIISAWIQKEKANTDEIYQYLKKDNHLDSTSSLFDMIDARKSETQSKIYIAHLDQQLVYWSSNKVIPNIVNISSFGDEEKLVKINNAYHLMKVNPLPNGYFFISLLTVYQTYPVENSNLESGYLLKNSELKRTVITGRNDATDQLSLPVYSQSGKVLFYIKYNPFAKRLVLIPIVFMEIIGLILVFLIVNRWLRYFLFHNRLFQAFLLTIAYFLWIDLYVNLFQIPSFTGIGNVFQLDSYASVWADSLGELLFRVHLLHWALRHWMRYLFLKFKFRKKIWRSIFISFYLAFSFYFIIFIIGSLLHNSIVSFDLYRFDQIDLSTFIGLLIVNFSIGILYLPINYLQSSDIDKRLFFSHIPFHVFFILIGYYLNFFENVQFVFGVLVIYLIYFWVLKWVLFENQKGKEKWFSMRVLLLSVYALIGAYCILFFTNERKKDLVQHYAVELASERDYAEEYDIANIVEEIKVDNFIKSYFDNPYLSSFDINRRVLQRYFNKYQGKYNISIHTFNNVGMQLKGEGTKTFYALKTNKNEKGVQEISPDLYYLSVKPRGEKYMAFIEYYNENQLVGYLVTVFTPKTFTSYSAYPELLKTNQEYSMDSKVSNLSYAIYRNKRLMSVNGNYSYPINFMFPLLESGKYIYKREGDFHHVIYRMDEKQVVVSYKDIGMLSSFSYFSYLLIIQILFFYLLSLMTDYGNFWVLGRQLKRKFTLNSLQKQMQISMVSQVLVSLVLIGSMTVFFFNVQYNHMHNESLKQRGHSVVDALESLYAESFVENHDEIFNNILKSKMKQLSEIFAIDMNAYDLNGRLLYSSQPEIFKGGLLSNLINISAYKALKIKEYSSFIHEEYIGKLKFMAAYLPVSDPNGKLVAYMNFPYYGKEMNIKNDISFFLMSLINIYALLIIGAVVISLWVSRVIVKPLSIITENIKDVQLGKKNRHIEWKNKDEVGHLVSEYNRMIDELEESAGLLAKSEREGAWREMAKQVAHEIKNPLTPMKLSIQYMQRAIEENLEDKEEMIKKISSRLIEQIDTLSGIATAFSNFAKMPAGQPQNENIVPILYSLVELFKTTEYVNIFTSIPEHPIEVFVDRDQIFRVFTNLIKNAIQSIPDEHQVLIFIKVEEIDNNCIISVKDNGIGIPPERIDIIFEPNFTTKSSGTGLGLAISRSIIESAGGKIWAESGTDNEGSIFYVQLPIVKS